MFGSSFAARVVRLALAAVVVAALFVGAFLWGLQQGPVPLPFLDPRIAAAVSALAPDVVATVERTELVRVGRGVALRVTGLRLTRKDGTPLLLLPALTVRPSLRALLHGKLVIARIGVADGELALTHTVDGAWLLGAGEGSAGLPIADTLGGPAGEPAGEVVLPMLTLARTRLHIDDQRVGGTMDLSAGDLYVMPREGGIDVWLRADLHLASTTPGFRGTITLPALVTGSVERAADGTLGKVVFALAGDAGELALPDDAGPPFALTGLDTAGVYLPDVETVRFERLGLTLGASKVAGTMTVILRRPGVLALAASVDALPLAVLTRLWPPEQAKSVRTWLAEHTREGTLRKCRVQLGIPLAPDVVGLVPDVARVPEASEAAAGDGTASAAATGAGTKAGAAEPAAAPTAPAKPAYDIACDFDGVTAHYLPPMAPIRAASGSARLTADKLDVQVRKGEVGACTVERGTLVMDLTVDPPRAVIAADVNGASAEVLALVDAPPLELVTPLGITPKDLGGASRVHAELTLPIKSSMSPREVGVQATAALTGASLPPLVAGIGIADGTLAVTTDGNRLAVKGRTGVTGLPEVTKPVELALTYTPGKGTGERPGDGALTLAVDGEGIAVQGNATVAGKTLTTVTVERLRLGGHDVAATVRRGPNGAYEASLTGDRLDLAALLEDPRIKSGDATAMAASYDVAVHLGRVQTSADTELQDLTGSIQASNGTVTGLSLTAAMPAGGTFQATIDGPLEARRVSVVSDQASAVLKTLGITTEFDGGKLTLKATTDGRGPAAFLTGQLKLSDIRVVKAPVLAKVLSVGSLGNIASLLQGKQGIVFSKIKFPFRWTAPKLELTDVRAIGGIGLTGDGVLDRDAATCDVRGNVIPYYSLNTALGKVPVLGKIPILGALVGGDGKGIFGIAYRVSGKLPDPSVSVNPLTWVAPSVLRGWFIDPFSRASDDEPASAPPPPRARRRR